MKKLILLCMTFSCVNAYSQDASMRMNAIGAELIGIIGDNESDVLRNPASLGEMDNIRLNTSLEKGDYEDYWGFFALVPGLNVAAKIKNRYYENYSTEYDSGSGEGCTNDDAADIWTKNSSVKLLKSCSILNSIKIGAACGYNEDKYYRYCVEYHPKQTWENYTTDYQAEIRTNNFIIGSLFYLGNKNRLELTLNLETTKHHSNYTYFIDKFYEDSYYKTAYINDNNCISLAPAIAFRTDVSPKFGLSMLANFNSETSKNTSFAEDTSAQGEAFSSKTNSYTYYENGDNHINVTIGGEFKPSDKLTLGLGIKGSYNYYTRYSRETTIKYIMLDTTGPFELVETYDTTDENYRDETVVFPLGIEYKPVPQLSLRAGGFLKVFSDFDYTAKLNFGFGYKVNKNLALDLYVIRVWTVYSWGIQASIIL